MLLQSHKILQLAPRLDEEITGRPQSNPGAPKGPKSYGGYAWADESVLSGGNSPLIISNDADDDDDDDDLVYVSELFARADPAPTAATATATPAVSTHRRQISEAVPRDERLNMPKTTATAPQQQQASGGV